MVRLTVAEAAETLGISEAGVRERVQRDQIPHERDDDGRVWVWVSPAETRQTRSEQGHRDTRDKSRDRDETSRDELVAELRDRVEFLQRELERKDAILLNMTEAIKALSPPTPEGEPPTETPPNTREYAVTPTPQPGRVGPQVPLEGAQEPSEPPEMPADEQQGRGPVPDAGGPHEGAQPRPWWRQLLGG